MRLYAIKSITWALIICFSTQAHAASSTALDGMFTAITVPQAIKTPSMTGVAGGSFTLKVPTQSFNIIAFDPPRIDAGCGGVDMYLGSFSFINAEQLKGMLRQVAQGAVGYAFKAAIRSICGSCAATLDDLQHIMDRLNSVGKNTCAISKTIGDAIGSALPFKADEGESLLKVAKQTVDGWWDGNTETKSDGRSDPANPVNGNNIHRALITSDVNLPFKNEIPDLPMNLVGTYVVPAEGALDKQCKPGETGTCSKDPFFIKPSLDFDRIIDGAPSSNDVYVYKCDKPLEELGCQNPTKVLYTFEGTREYVRRMLWGASGNVIQPDSGSILQVVKASGSSGLSEKQKQLLAASSVNILAVMRRAQRHPLVAQALIAKSAEYMANDLTYKLINHTISVINEAYSRKKVEMPEETKTRIHALQADIAVKGYQSAESHMQTLANMELLLSNLEKSMPKAYAASGLKR